MHMPQFSGAEIKGTLLRKQPASGISLSRQTRRWRHGQDLRQHSVDWKQVDLWLVKTIVMLPRSTEKQARPSPLSFHLVNDVHWDPEKSVCQLTATQMHPSLSCFSPEIIIGLLKSKKKIDAKHWEMQFFGDFSLSLLKLILLFHKKSLRQMGMLFHLLDLIWTENH